MPLEVFARLPFGTPQTANAISVAAKAAANYLRVVVYFQGRVTWCPQVAQASIAGFPEFREAQ